MAVGLPLKTTYANGDVYSASDVNDTNGTINANVNPYTAGKNKIINGDFRVNQRNFTSNTASGSYNFDRWVQVNAGTTGTLTVTPQVFTPGTAPVSGYEGTNFVQCVTAAGASVDTLAVLGQYIEDVRTFAGQTVTISFWAKAASGTPKIGGEMVQFFGSGGSPSSFVATSTGSVTLSTSWARYSLTVAIPSIAGKTIGTTANSSSIQLLLWLSAGTTYATRSSNIGLQNNTFSIWGVQIEQGSTATAFQTATGNISGELAACQRYYWRNTPGTSYGIVVPAALIYLGNTIFGGVQAPVPMRVTPTSIDYANLQTFDTNNAATAISSISLTSGATGAQIIGLEATATGATANRACMIRNNNNANGYLGFSAEL